MNLMAILQPTAAISAAQRRYQTFVRCAAHARQEHVLRAAMRRTELQARILGAVSDWEGITNRELAILLDVSARRVRTAACELRAAGLIQMHGRAGWRVRGAA